MTRESLLVAFDKLSQPVQALALQADLLVSACVEDGASARVNSLAKVTQQIISLLLHRFREEQVNAIVQWDTPPSAKPPADADVLDAALTDALFALSTLVERIESLREGDSRALEELREAARHARGVHDGYVVPANVREGA